MFTYKCMNNLTEYLSLTLDSGYKDKDIIYFILFMHTF